MICPVCQRAELEVFFEGGHVPVFVNVLFEAADAARAAAQGEVRLGGCPHCGFVHNVAFDPALTAYAPGYENSLHGSPAFQEWARGLARELVEAHGLAGGSTVEVGGGRGEFTELLVEAGVARGLVMDPSAPDDALRDEADGVTIQRRLFEPGDTTPAGGPAAGLVLTRHVLEHIPEPHAFVEALAGGARAACAGLYVEVPNGLWTLRDLGVWDVIYEHCSYFTPRSLALLLARHGAHADVREDYGGQFLGGSARSVGAADPDAAPERPGAEVELFARFRAAEAEETERWGARFDAWRREGRAAAIWGAGSKGATFLRKLDPAAELVRFAIDVNDRKHGLHVAGTGHSIVGPEALVDTDVDTIVVMNPRYAEEIERMARARGSRAEVLGVAA